MTESMLNWCAAIAIGHQPAIRPTKNGFEIVIEDWVRNDSVVKEPLFSPTDNDGHCGILIDRYCLATCKPNPLLDGFDENEIDPDCIWACVSYDGTVCTHGPDRKIAAVRNVIMAELGDWVEVPLQLVEK